MTQAGQRIPDRRVALRFGGSAAVYIDGDLNAPVTVLLLHGCSRDAATWDPVVELLTGSEDRLRIVRVEHRGHGRSPLGRAPISMDLLGEDIGRVIDAVRPQGPLVIGGHSMGGMAVMGLARRRPDLFSGGAVRGVLLASTSPGGRRTGSVRRPPERPGPEGHEEGFSRQVGYLLAAVSLARGIAPVTVSRYFSALMNHHVPGGIEVLSSSSVRILVGDQDRWTPPGHAQRLADLIPGSSLRVIPGAGHYLPGSHPALLADALSSLAAEAAQVATPRLAAPGPFGARRLTRFLSLAAGRTAGSSARGVEGRSAV